MLQFNRAYATADLLPEARRMAEEIASGPTAAFHISKSILQRNGDFDAMLDEEARLQARAIRNHDAIEGFTAFQQERKPFFTGR